VPEFWAELRDAAMPQTRLLVMPTGEETHFAAKPHEHREAELPPRPQPAEFEPRPQERLMRDDPPARPRIVVPVAVSQAAERVPAAVAPAPVQKPAQVARAESPRTEVAPQTEPRASFLRRLVPQDRMQRWLAILLLLAGFVLLLLGTRAYVNSRMGSRTPSQQTANTAPANVNLQTGREMTTITNVNLRNGPSRTHQKIGEVERGSRVRVLQCSGAWCEVEVTEHGLPRADESGADQGWLDARMLR